MSASKESTGALAGFEAAEIQVINVPLALSPASAGALANSITGSGANAGTDFRLRQRQSTTVRLPGYAGANNDNTAVVTFVQGNNGGASGLASNTVGSGGGGFVGGGGTCP